MRSRFFDEIDEARDHGFNERNVSAALASSAIPMAKVVLHVDHYQHAVTPVGALF
jgi:hypothetical protein